MADSNLDVDQESKILEQKIQNYCIDNLPGFLHEYFFANIQEISKLVNFKIQGILNAKKDQKVSEMQCVQFSVNELKGRTEVLEIFYAKYDIFMEECYPARRKMSFTEFCSSGPNFVGINKKNCWIQILSKGLRPGRIVNVENNPKDKFKIKEITPIGFIVLDGGSRKFDPKYIIVSAD
ncbi:hypothetical protein KKD70_01755 [Patescibacteria group bacterium]|nr:hypothetical protein [Patescibacteria group bacterium]